VIARAADVRDLLGRRGPQARQLLRKLVVDRLDCQPYEEGDRRGYRVSGKGTYARLLPSGGWATHIGVPHVLRRLVALSLSFAIQARQAPLEVTNPRAIAVQQLTGDSLLGFDLSLPGLRIPTHPALPDRAWIGDSLRQGRPPVETRPGSE